MRDKTSLRIGKRITKFATTLNSFLNHKVLFRNVPDSTRNKMLRIYKFKVQPSQKMIEGNRTSHISNFTANHSNYRINQWAAQLWELQFLAWWIEPNVSISRPYKKLNNLWAFLDILTFRRDKIRNIIKTMRILYEILYLIRSNYYKASFSMLVYTFSLLKSMHFNFSTRVEGLT